MISLALGALVLLIANDAELAPAIKFADKQPRTGQNEFSFAGFYEVDIVKVDPTASVLYRASTSKVWLHKKVTAGKGVFGGGVSEVQAGKYQVKVQLQWEEGGVTKSVETNVVDVTVPEKKE